MIYDSIWNYFCSFKYTFDVSKIQIIKIYHYTVFEKLEP